MRFLQSEESYSAGLAADSNLARRSFLQCVVAIGDEAIKIGLGFRPNAEGDFHVSAIAPGNRKIPTVDY